MNITRSPRDRSRFPFAALLLSLAAGLLLFPSRSTGEGAIPSDVASVDGVMQALYESISFPEGKVPDWARYRNLFSSAGTPCVRIAPDGVRVMDRESFIAYFKERLASGVMKGFVEREIARTTEGYGGIVQVISAYAKRSNPADPGTEARGINALQLYFKDGRWWIASIVWQDEQPGVPIPPKYLK